MTIFRLLRPALAGACVLWAAASHAAGWPDKPVTIIVPSAAGGAADLTARTFAQYLGEKTGQTVIVEDRPGAGGIVGTNASKNAAPDGYTFLLSTNSTHSANQFLYKTLPYDAQKDFVQVGMLGTFGTVGVVSPDSPYRTVPELVEYAKKHPGDVFFGYYSSSSQVPSELFKQRAGINITGAAYKNITQIITDLRGKQIGFAFVDYLTAMGQIDGKGLVPIAVTGARQHDAWPSVPTMATYYPDFVVAGWLGLSAPARTPPEIVAKLEAACEKAVNSDGYKADVEPLDTPPHFMNAKAFGAFARSESEKYTKLIQDIGINVDQ